jgi:putative membrane protein insertion efficiency factor
VTTLGVAAVWLWRHTFGLLTPAGTCKYHPSCSQYAIDALRAHGFLKGSLLAGWRLLRCNPWSHGGVDYAEGAKLFGRRDDREGRRPA